MTDTPDANQPDPKKPDASSDSTSNNAPLPGDPADLLGVGLPSQSDTPTADASANAATGSAARSSGSRGPGFVPLTVEELDGQFPQLQILELLGHGGMGAVYKAKQTSLDRIVAVKILPPQVNESPAFAERFTREARALARLNHANIVAVHDFGKVESPQGDLYYITMEYIDGTNLRHLMRSGTMTPSQALAIVAQVCEALQFAHDEGVVHRDIKPENILIDAKGRVKIADFGLAKLARPEGEEHDDLTLTHTHAYMGTPRYMAPEQVEGAKQVDHRADIYSLGVVFYELLTGELPLGRFDPPSRRVQVDVRLDEVVLRTLEKEPARRYQQASEVKTEVDSISRSVTDQTPLPHAGAGAIGSSVHTSAAPAASVSSEAEFGVVPIRSSSRTPAELLVAAAIMALLTGIGIVAWWLLTGEYDAARPYKGSAKGTLQWNMMMIAGTHGGYALFIGSAAMLMLGLRARLLSLLIVIVVGLLMPAMFIVNVAGETVPEWPALIPFWLAMPVALWAVAALLRQDARSAYEQAREARLHSRSITPPPMPVDRGRVFAVVAVWTIVLLVIGTLTIGMTESMSSRRYDFQESFVLKPRSGAFIQLEVVAKAGGVLRGYEAPPKTFDELVLTLHPLKALQPGQGAGEMTINLSQPGYRYAARDGEYYLEREYVTAQVMLDWMKEAGVDVQQTAVREEAAALIDAANRARKIRPRDAIRQADSSFDLFQTGSRHDIEGFDKAYAIHWSVVGVIWFLGAGLAFVTRRRWAPLKNRREWKPGDDISGFVCAIVAVVMLCLAMIIPGILLAVSETDRGTNAAGITFLIGITLAAIFGLLGHHFRMGRFSAAFALVIGIGVFGLLFLRGASHGSPQEHNPTALTDGPNVPHITGRQGKLPSADPVNLPRLAGPATGLDVLKIPVGTWDVVRTIRQHPTLTPGTKVNGKMSFRTVLDGRFVTMAVRYDNGDHWLLIQGYDEKKDEYPTWIFPPQGPVVHVRKKWDEKSRMLVPIGQDGGPVDNDVVGRMIDDDTMEARFVMRDRDGRVRMDSLQVSTRTSKEPSDDVMRNVDRRNPNGPAELAAYDGFVGEFDFELMDSMADDKSWMPAGHSRTQWILDGRFILRETFDPDDKLNVIGLKTYDPDARSYREWHFFATGAWMEVRATWDEDTKRFSYQGTVNDGATLAGVEFPTSKGYEWTAIFKDESGGVMADLSARLNRKP